MERAYWHARFVHLGYLAHGICLFKGRDAQGSLAVVESAKRGQSSVMIGLNQNLFDLTYVDNVSHAHILAADKMEVGSGIEGEVSTYAWQIVGIFHYERSTHILLGLSQNFVSPLGISKNSLDPTLYNICVLSRWRNGLAYETLISRCCASPLDI